jgi:hypothetical protein
MENVIIIHTDCMPGAECDNPNCHERSNARWSSDQTPGYYPTACDEDCAKAAFDLLRQGDFAWVKGDQRLKKSDGTLGNFVGIIGRCPKSPWHHYGSTCKLCGAKN